MSVSDHSKMTVDEQAALWLARVSASDVSDQDFIDLTLWLEASEAHLRAFGRAEEIWYACDGLGSRDAAQPKALPNTAVVVDFAAYKKDPAPRHSAKWPSGTGLVWGAFGALAASLAALIYLPTLMAPPSSTIIQTGKGQSREIALSDGTRLHLNTDTRITVHVTAKSRELTLERGELAVDVAHDETRPFSISVGSARLTDIGTAFDVLRNNGRVTVTVKNGSVGVSPSRELSSSENRAVILRAGDQAIIQEASANITELKVNPLDAYAWQRGQAVYQNQPLADVVKDLNRYLKKPLVVDEITGQLRVSAVFNLDSETSVVKGLTAFLPIEATTTESAITLTRRH